MINIENVSKMVAQSRNTVNWKNLRTHFDYYISIFKISTKIELVIIFTFQDQWENELRKLFKILKFSPCSLPQLLS